MFPFHTWLPDAHVEAPTAGSVILAGVLLEDGDLRLRAILAADPARTPRCELLPWMAGLSISRHHLRGSGRDGAEGHEEAGRLLIGEPLWVRDAGSLRAQWAGLNGGILQMINHGLSTGALFLLVGVIYERDTTRMIADYGGISRDAEVRHYFLDHHHVVDRSSGSERLYR